MSKTGNIKLYSDTELEGLPPPSWLVNNLIPHESFILIYGASGCGKTHCVLSLACSIATKTPWLDKHITSKGSTVYVAAEGLRGIAKRLAANKQNLKIQSIPDIFFTGDAIDLNSEESVVAFIEAIKNHTISPSLIVFDTFARCFSGDENSAKDTSRAIHHIYKIIEAFNCTIILIHHTGKNQFQGARGSSALFAAADTVIEVIEERVGPTFVCKKQKDFESFPDIHTVFRTVELGGGETSIIVTAATVSDFLKLPADGGEDCKAILKVIEEHGDQGIGYTALQNELQKQNIKISNSTFNRRLKDLFQSGKIEKNGNGKGARYLIKPQAPASLSLPNNIQSPPMEANQSLSSTPPI